MKILVVDDEVQNRDALTEILKRLGHEVTTAPDGSVALAQVSAKRFNLILSDIRMPVMDGLQFFDASLQLFKKNGLMTPFVFMTAYGKLEEAVHAMKRGALHFLTKPLKKKDLIAVLDEISVLNKSAEQSPVSMASSEMVFESFAMQNILKMVDQVSSSLVSVLLTGESGAGKEVIARMIHEKSARKNEPFVAFNAASVPEPLIESELFGHEKGAFTGADRTAIGMIRSADHGTFFLDEAALMPHSLQSKLLRVLQEREVQPLGSTRTYPVDIRIISASNENLENVAKSGRFREDLLFRLNVVQIKIPALRDRVEDIEKLTTVFLSEFANRDGKTLLTLLPATLERLKEYSWPGNIRELRNVVERAVVLANGNEFSPDLLPEHISKQERSSEIRFTVGSSLQSIEDRLIEETLKICDGDKSKAATILGVNPRTIYRWLEKRTL